MVIGDKWSPSLEQKISCSSESKEQRHGKTNYPSLLTETLEGDAATFKQAVNTYIKLNPKERELCEGSGSEEMLL